MSLKGLLKRFGGVANHSELLKRTKMDCGEFAKAIKTLGESEEIISSLSGYKKVYYLNIQKPTSDTDV